MRQGVRATLGDTVHVVGEAASVSEAIAVLAETKPDVALVDVHLPDGTASDVITKTKNYPTKFLALSVSDSPKDVIATIRAGARGYVTKSIASDDLVDALRRVAEGDAVFSPRLAGFVLDAFAASSPAEEKTSELDLLTPRESEVMRLLARGYAYKEIAARLTISIKTVETHASNVLRKLQLSSRNELTYWAVQRKIV